MLFWPHDHSSDGDTGGSSHCQGAHGIPMSCRARPLAMRPTRVVRRPDACLVVLPAGCPLLTLVGLLSERSESVLRIGLGLNVKFFFMRRFRGALLNVRQASLGTSARLVSSQWSIAVSVQKLHFLTIQFGSSHFHSPSGLFELSVTRWPT